MENLNRHGWTQWPLQQQGKAPRPIMGQMPTNPNDVARWTESRSSYFKYKFLGRVCDIRNEFAQFHLRDQRLDNFCKSSWTDVQIVVDNRPKLIEITILPQEIEEVAERLRILAEQIK
jgi:hypothetical protein